MSSTSWSESIGPVAAFATLEEMKRINVPQHVEASGKEVQKHWKELADKWKLPVEVYGFPALSGFRFSHPASERLRTIFTREMLTHGFLAGTAFYPSLGHNEQIVKKYEEALDQVFAVLSKSLESGTYRNLPEEEVARSGFSRLV